ncbi:inosine 5-monophosphate dehydrogenase [Corynebacterium kutscheri]|uniref:IMP dehydrogenase family protein n=1 Tax=Corynebacterium kutscheri TaxID=35755 RepID=A0A0F6TCU4_9CORY|nr:GuaB3 family IMP dehydrogenase-related protein [Corynebacterium kutscheri]AKE40634.1 IMP dehydrogenase family protein [Corynebacterium kutscheri]VEH04809.1 inosine 5-monophosphate dehydrogenase [Corynebacterium kutscheri]VEH11031.1 inosine 5-monophosphate dehydrogenase [Corynebacterium kutscheri]VEH80490.1 inosine 5-monophosphate dehydrogenase [Corynebacterium kutscheri]
MRDYVEIGIGREARRTYHLSDISVLPARRTRSSKNVDTTWHIDAYTFQLPFLSHPTDALASPEFIIEMDKQGGLAVINAEGLWGRHADLQAAINEVVQTFTADAYDPLTVGLTTKKLQELHSAPIDTDLLTQRIGQVRDSGATVAARVSPQHARELAPILVKAGVELLIIQGTIISAEHVDAHSEPMNLKELIRSFEVPVIAGGVSDYTTALHVMRAGAVGVIVGSGYTTNNLALGIGAGMATIIADAAAARRDYLDETGGRYVHIIADGSINTSGEVVKAIACGADAVVLGEPLANAVEAAGQGVYWESTAAHPRFPRGLITKAEPFSGEQPSLETILHGPSTSPFGEANIVGGLKRAMAKCGFTELKQFQKVDITVN